MFDIIPTIYLLFLNNLLRVKVKVKDVSRHFLASILLFSPDFDTKLFSQRERLCVDMH